jgi:hypothetical protein
MLLYGFAAFFNYHVHLTSHGFAIFVNRNGIHRQQARIVVDHGSLHLLVALFEMLQRIEIDVVFGRGVVVRPRCSRIFARAAAPPRHYEAQNEQICEATTHCFEESKSLFINGNLTALFLRKFTKNAPSDKKPHLLGEMRHFLSIFRSVIS